MSGQNTLVVIAEAAQVKRPGDLFNWQVYRGIEAAGAGVYRAMNMAGVIEIIGGPGVGVGSQLSVAITYVAGTRTLTATPTGGTVGANSYVWRIASDTAGVGEQDFAFAAPSTTNTIVLDAPAETANGLVEVKVTDSLGRISYGTFFVRELVAIP